MSRIVRRPRRFAPLIFAALAGLAFLSWERPAHAQWGMGMGRGWGMGGGGFISNAATMRNINNRSSQAARHAYNTRAGMTPRVSGANSYVNHTRDASFGERFSVSTRRTIGEDVARRPATAVTETSSTNGEASRRVEPLESFFSTAGALVWPGGAPDDGPLGSQKAAADSAVSAVFREVKDGGRAPIALVGDARSALVGYGQPALDYLREHTTPAVVDGFHRFLLGLYDSLGRVGLARAAEAPHGN